MAQTQTSSITYTKLRDGSWGLRGANLTAGATVTVAKRDGSTKTETVGRIVWEGTGLRLATIAPARRSAHRTEPSPLRPFRGCGHCRALGRMCAQCRFDEYDF